MKSTYFLIYLQAQVEVRRILVLKNLFFYFEENKKIAKKCVDNFENVVDRKNKAALDEDPYNYIHVFIFSLSL